MSLPSTNIIMHPGEEEITTLADVDDVMILNEEVDMDALRVIRDNFEIVYERLGSSFSEYSIEKNEWVEVDFKTASTIINNFYNQKKNNTKIKYAYGKKLKNGRRFASNSLQTLCRPLRHTISKNLYDDVDMKNAHPTFLANYVNKIQFEHPILKKYIDQRDELLTSWIGTTGIYKKIPNGYENTTLATKDDVKKYFLAVLNGGGSNKTTCKELNEFYDKHQTFLTLFYNHPENINYKYRADNKYKTLNKDKKDNRRGTCLNYYLCDVENKALSHMERYLISKKIKYGTLCFDGIMIYKTDVDNIEELLIELEGVLYERMGFQIRLSVKIMDEDVNISDLSIIDNVKLTEQDYALHMLKILDPIVKYDLFQKQLYVYNDNTALWAPQKISHLRIYLTDILDEYISKHPDAKEAFEAKEIIRRNSTQNNIISMMGPYIDMKDDSKFIVENFDCSKGFLPIANNLVIDFKTNTTRPRVKTDYFTKTTENVVRDITEEERAITMKYFYDWLNTSDEEYVECLLKCIAYIFSGETYLKAIFNFIGQRDGGKSTFLDLLSEILGPFYCIANERLFINQKNKAVHDSEMFNLLGKRMATLSETKKSQSYNTTLMKAISGNDKQNIRAAGEKQTIDVLFRCILAIATNEPCKFDDAAFGSRLWCFNFSNTFERNDTFVGVLKSRKDLIFTIIAEYGQKLYSGKITQVKQVKQFTESIIENQDSVKKWCRSQTYVKTDNKSDYVENSTLFDKYTNDCKENMEETKIYGKIDFYKRFKEFYGLDEAILIKYKEDGVEKSVRGFRYLKESSE